jgi:hypothetical protein
MEIKASVLLDLKSLEALRAKIDAQLNGAEGPVHAALRQWAARYRSFAQLRFNQYSRGGGDWAPLADSTVRSRRGGKGLLNKGRRKGSRLKTRLKRAKKGLTRRTKFLKRKIKNARKSLGKTTRRTVRKTQSTARKLGKAIPKTNRQARNRLRKAKNNVVGGINKVVGGFAEGVDRAAKAGQRSAAGAKKKLLDTRKKLRRKGGVKRLVNGKVKTVRRTAKKTTKSLKRSAKAAKRNIKKARKSIRKSIKSARKSVKSVKRKWRTMKREQSKRAAKAKKLARLRATILRDTNTLFTALSPVFVGSPGAIEEQVSYGIRVGFGGSEKHPGEKKSPTIAQIAEYHQVGGGRLPRRMIIVAPPEEVLNKMAGDMTRALKRAAEETK